LPEDDLKDLKHVASCYVLTETYLSRLKDWMYLFYR